MKCDVTSLIDVIAREYFLQFILADFMTKFLHCIHYILSCYFSRGICVKLFKDSYEALLSQYALDLDGGREEFGIVDHLITVIVDFIYYLFKLFVANFDVCLIECILQLSRSDISRLVFIYLHENFSQILNVLVVGHLN